MKTDRVLSLLGLAMKAGRIESGEFSTEKAVKSQQAALVIVSSDASDNTKKMFTNMCTYYQVPFCCYGTKDELGPAIGKEIRASLAVTDEVFRDAIIKEMDNINR